LGVSAIAVSACSFDEDWIVRYGEPDFHWGFGVDSADQLHVVLLGYHFTVEGADCVVAAIFTPEFAPDSKYGSTYTVTAEDLETAVRQCGIDTSTIWTTTD
jgi:hypothetical protein